MRHGNAARTGFGLAALIAFALAPAVATRSWSNAPDGWKTDINAVLAEAAANGKPVFAVFSAKGCPPCKHMSEQVLPTERVKRALDGWNYVYVYWDSDAWHNPNTHEPEPAAFAKYEVHSFPTLLMLSPKGEIMLRLEGARSAPALAKLLKNQPEYGKRKRELALKLAENPKDPALHKAMGDVEMLISEYEAAFNAYKKAAALDPQDATGVSLDITFFSALPTEESDLQRSLDALTKFEADHPNTQYNAWARFYRGLISSELGKTAEAIRLFESGLKDFPDSDYAESMAGTLAELKKGGRSAE